MRANEICKDCYAWKLIAQEIILNLMEFLNDRYKCQTTNRKEKWLTQKNNRTTFRKTLLKLKTREISNFNYKLGKQLGGGGGGIQEFLEGGVSCFSETVFAE